MPDPAALRLAVDIGGTFTDVVLTEADGRVLATTKTPTTPRAPTDGALVGVRRALSEAGRAASEVGLFIHGATLATNALIERRGAPVATVATAGFRDILEIGYERRHSQYDLNIDKPDLIVPRAMSFTIAERMSVGGEVLTPLDEAAVPALAEAIVASGAEAAAICLLHSYANPAHERRLGALLAEAAPGLVISLSSEVSPEAREFDRLCTTVANAYIQPLMSGYLADFQARMAAEGVVGPILMMTASGGMTTLETAARWPIRLVESGPAGGAVLAAEIARRLDAPRVVSFDMGGTTAKLCLIDDGAPQTARRFEISRAARFVKGSGMPVRIPAIEMIEIGAGGGSLASVDALGRLAVGPKSAGSEPGPAAFGKGGRGATVTDADFTLGYLDADGFAEGRITLDRKAAERALLADIGAPLSLSARAAAFGVGEIVDEAMASAGRMHAVESGKDLSERTMIAFGGNGPLHATRLARRAGIGRIVVPPDPGVGSAVGFLFAPVSFEVVRSRHETLAEIDFAALNRFLGEMTAEAEAVVRPAAAGAPLSARRVAFMRYRGQGHELEIPLPERALTEVDRAALADAFEAEYRAQFTRAVPGMAIEVLNWGVTVAAPRPRAAPSLSPISSPPQPAASTPRRRRIICDMTGDEVEAVVFLRCDLAPGAGVDGPALVEEAQTTTLVSADFSARLSDAGDLILTRKDAP